MIGLGDYIYYFTALSGMILAALLVPIFRLVALKFNIVDKPSQPRKIHKKAIPLLGGVAIFVSTAVLIAVVRLFELADFSQMPDKYLIGIFLASLILMLTGFLDDKYNLSPSKQILGPLLAVIIMLAVGVKINFITNPFGESSNAILYFGYGLGTLVTFFWLMGMMYTTKFLDGLDGLASGISVIAAVFIFLLGLQWDIAMSATGVLALIFAGSIFGFLLYNWHPAKIFLGEGGSIWLGFMLGVLSIISGSKIATTLLVVGIPALDVLWVIMWRLMKHESPFSHADNKHLHYQLLRLGFSIKGAVLFLYFVALVFGSLAIFSSSLGKVVSLLFLILLMMVLVITYLKRNSKYETIS